MSTPHTSPLHPPVPAPGLASPIAAICMFLQLAKSFSGVLKPYGRGEGLVDSPRRRSEAVFAPVSAGVIGARIGASLGCHRGPMTRFGGGFRG